mgnify:CR=1 FL=1
MAKFLLHWIGRAKPEVIEGMDIQNAFDNAGIGKGALPALDYWEPAKAAKISNFSFSAHSNQDYQVDSYFVSIRRGENHRTRQIGKRIAEDAIRRLGKIDKLVKLDFMGNELAKVIYGDDIEFKRK